MLTAVIAEDTIASGITNNSGATMDNYCPSVAMPPARKDSNLRPYDIPVRPESVVDLDFKRNREQKIIGIINIARSFNALGKPYVLKKCFAYAKNALKEAGVKFIDEDATISHLKHYHG